MIRKICISIFIIFIICNMNCTVMAADFHMKCDSNRVEKEEQIAVTVFLDEAIPVNEDITNVQGELYYDASVLTYVSHELSEWYENYTSKHMTEKERIQFSRTSATNTAFEVQQGDVATVIFSVNKNAIKEEVSSMLRLRMKISTSDAVTTETNSYADIVIKQNDICMEETEAPEGATTEKKIDSTNVAGQNVTETEGITSKKDADEGSSAMGKTSLQFHENVENKETQMISKNQKNSNIEEVDKTGVDLIKENVSKTTQIRWYLLFVLIVTALFFCIKGIWKRK